jgi:ABC-type multidrug transport system fused ATPase/permease subunit
LIFFGINGFFAYGFYFSGYAKWSDFKDGNGEPVTTGTILTVIMAVVISSIGLNAIGPNLQTITEAKVAGTLAFRVIDHKPKILPNEPGTTILNKDNVKGQIEFKNVNFSYPSKKD